MYTRDKIATVTHSRTRALPPYKRKVGSGKCLAVEIDEFLTWDSHITSVSKKVYLVRIGVLKKTRPFVPTSNLISVYQAIVEPYFGYCSFVWTTSATVSPTNFKSCKIVLHE